MLCALDDGREAIVERYLREGRDAWPDVVVEPARFANELERRAAGLDLAAIKGADVYVAIACIDGDQRAIEAVRALLAREVGFAATKTTATPDQLAEVTAQLSRVLFVDEPGRVAAMRDYSGRGSLKAYLGVIATRELVRVVNRGRREVGIDDDDLIDRIVPASDPEISILRAQYRDDVDAAIRAAMGSLDDRGRALLRYAFVDGMNVDRVGALYNVHRATAARWIAAVREKLGDQIRDQLAARLRIAVGEVDSIIRLVQSRIDVSLDRMLQPEQPEP
jgi:RNA polymerase sigma-70 factor (ECF subfamily)